MGQRTFDRIRNFGGGVDAYRPASEIEPNQSQLMQNMIVLDNFAARTRPGADQAGATSFANNVTNPIPVGSTYNSSGFLALSNLIIGVTYTYTFGANDIGFNANSIIYSAPGSGTFVAGATTATLHGTANAAVTLSLSFSSPVQSLFFFNTPAKGSLLVTFEAGNLYTWDGASWSGPLYSVSNAVLQPSMDQGINAMMIADGVKYPVYWDGTTFTQYTVTDGAFLEGCTIICFAAGRMIASGNPANPDTMYLSNLLAYEPASLNGNTSNWNSATLSFRIGNGDGEAIIGISVVQGQLVAVLKENSVYLVDLTSANTDPTNPTQAFTSAQQGDLVGTGIGCVGKNAFCNYQNDLLFMSQDGVQSLQRMQAAAGQYELSTPLSEPIQPLIDRINWSVANVISAVKYRNLAIFFVPLDASSFNNYALVWNSLLEQWTGFWTGIACEMGCVTRYTGLGRTAQLYLGGQDGTVNLFKDANDLVTLDATYLDNGNPIASELDTRALVFGDFDAQKKPRALQVRFNQGNATVNFTATMDLSDDDAWSQSVAPTGGALPMVFDINNNFQYPLQSLKPVIVYRSIEGLPYFNEIYTKITSSSGWWEVRNVTMAAFLKPMKNPDA